MLTDRILSRQTRHDGKPDRYVVATVAFAVLVVCAPASIHAQACFGGPSRGSIAYENVRYTSGTGHGVNAAYGGRVAFAARGQTESATFGDVTGFGGGARVAVAFSASRLQLCPGIGLEYGRNKWNPYTNVSVVTQQLAARAGLALGSEIDVYKGLSIIPAAGVHYEFRVYKFDATGPEAEKAAVTGDTASHVAIDYSLMARYRFVFLGARGERFSDSKGARPYSARYVLGFTFGSRRDD